MRNVMSVEAQSMVDEAALIAADSEKWLLEGMEEIARVCYEDGGKSCPPWISCNRQMLLVCWELGVRHIRVTQWMRSQIPRGTFSEGIVIRAPARKNQFNPLSPFLLSLSS